MISLSGKIFLTSCLVFLLSGSAIAAAEETAPPTQPALTSAAYAATVLDLANRVKNITGGKFMYASKVTAFIPKKDTFGNAAASNYYSAQAKTIEDIKVKLAGLAAPQDCIGAQKSFGLALDEYIAGYQKAVEALQKDDADMMVKETEPLLKSAQDHLLQANQSLQTIKMRQGA